MGIASAHGGRVGTGVMLTLLDGPMHYKDILSAVRSLNSDVRGRRHQTLQDSVLTRTLRQATDDGLIDRYGRTAVFSSSVLYALTPSGRELLNAVVPLVHWGELHPDVVSSAPQLSPWRKSADHLLAPAIAHALTRLLRDGRVSDIRCSLIATAAVLLEHPTPDGLDVADPAGSPADTPLTSTAWGLDRRVAIPGRIEGTHARLRIDAGPLGRRVTVWTRT
jgi:DNA-binding HxlR family transcriptional regulator